MQRQGMSMSAIGRAFAVHHTSVMHGLRRLDGLRSAPSPAPRLREPRAARPGPTAETFATAFSRAFGPDARYG
jgi:hypothetical protein